MPRMWQGLYPLMIRVNMAHSLHFCGEVRKKQHNSQNTTHLRAVGAGGNNNKKQHLTAQNALHPRERPQLLLHVQRGELWEKWLLRWKWLRVCLCMCETCVCVCASERVRFCQCEGRRRMDRKALSKKIFQKHFAWVTLTRARWLTCTSRQEPALSTWPPRIRNGTVLWEGPKWQMMFLKTLSVNNVRVFWKCASAEDGKVFNQSFDWTSPAPSPVVEDQNCGFNGCAAAEACPRDAEFSWDDGQT